MTEIDAESADAFFQPRSDAASAGAVDPDAVGTNAMRALILVARGVSSETVGDLKS